MKIDLGQFQQLYLQESTEHVAAIESGLLELRIAPGDLDLLNTIFRAAHSIKGGAGSFGLENLVRFTHALEGLLDQLRSGSTTASEAAIATMLQSVDVLRQFLAADAPEAMPPEAKGLMQRLQEFGGHADTAESSSAAYEQSLTEAQVYRVRFCPSPNIFTSGCNPLLLVRNLQMLGEVLLCALDQSSLPDLHSLDPTACYLAWTIELRTEACEAELREVFEFVEDLASISIERVDVCSGHTANGTLQAEEVAPAGTQESSVTLAHEPVEGIRVVAASTTKRPNGAVENSIRVSTDKVDRLVNLVGEIVIAQSMTDQTLQNFTPEMLPRMRDAAAALERSVRELHESVMSIRMLPIGTLFQRYTRTVYDIAQTTGKQVRLELSGSEAEIDKSMLELLADPMIHLVRNAVDHGIEEPQVRRAMGKPEQGTIHLRASHRGGKVVLQIQDDGAGIDPERVRRKAVERGLISGTAEMSDAQLRMLIFEPGFSTRDEVSDLSGRGVGMDVVRRNIQQMSGVVSLESTVGKGSCITVELPLTLAILDGLIIRTEDRRMVLPLLNVLETVYCQEENLIGIVGMGEVFVLRGESLPVLRLNRYFNLPAVEQSFSRPLIVVIESDSHKVGLLLDEVLGQQQVVLKSLETHLHKVAGMMGATVLGDGSVAPILDVAALAAREQSIVPDLRLRAAANTPLT